MDRQARTLRARLAAQERYGSPGAGDTRRALRVATAEEYISRLLEATPPLSAEDKLHLTRLLTT